MITKIIDVNSHDKVARTSVAKIHNMLKAIAMEPKGKQGAIQFGVSGARSLTKPVQFLKHEARRLLDVELFQKPIVEEC
jgi:hypothetical protein